MNEIVLTKRQKMKRVLNLQQMCKTFKNNHPRATHKNVADANNNKEILNAFKSVLYHQRCLYGKNYAQNSLRYLFVATQGKKKNRLVKSIVIIANKK